MAHVSFVWCISRRYTALWENNAELKVTNTRHALSAFLQTMRELVL